MCQRCFASFWKYTWEFKIKMINCCAQVACYAIKMIGSGLMFYKTGAGIHVQN